MPVEAMSPRDSLIANGSLAAQARVMMPTPKSEKSTGHSCRVSRCGCVAPDGMRNRSPRSHARFCPFRCEQTTPTHDQAQAADHQLPPPPTPAFAFGRKRANSRNRITTIAPTSENDAQAGEAAFRSKAPAFLDTQECNVAADELNDVGQPQPSPSTNELTDSLLGKTEDLLRRMVELGVDAIKTPKGWKDLKIDESVLTSPEDDCSEKAESCSQDGDKTDEEATETKRDIVEVPIELWKIMEEKFQGAITTDMNDSEKIAALRKLQDTIANECQNSKKFRKNALRDNVYDDMLLRKNASRDDVFDDMLASRSSLATSTDCPGTDLENESNSSSDGVASGVPAPRKDHVSRPVRAASPARLISQPLGNALLPRFKPATIHVRRRQSSPLGIRVLSPSPRSVGARASFGWCSPRDTLTSTTVSQTVNVTTSIQRTIGNPLSVTTNVQTSTRVDVSVRM